MTNVTWYSPGASGVNEKLPVESLDAAKKGLASRPFLYTAQL